MQQFFGRQLATTHKAVRAEFNARLEEAGGSLSAWIVLLSAQEEGDLSQRELAARMGVEGPTLVRHLDRLELAGLIERRRDRQDRRVTRIAVTADGGRLLAHLTTAAQALEAEVRSLLGPGEYDETVAVLVRIQAHMATLAGERKMDAHATRGI